MQVSRNIPQFNQKGLNFSNATQMLLAIQMLHKCYSLYKCIPCSWLHTPLCNIVIYSRLSHATCQKLHSFLYVFPSVAHAGPDFMERLQPFLSRRRHCFWWESCDPKSTSRNKRKAKFCRRIHSKRTLSTLLTLTRNDTLLMVLRGGRGGYITEE